VIAAMTIDAALYVCRHMRDTDRAEITRTRWDFDADDFALERHRAPGPRFMALRDGVPTWIGGIDLPSPGVGVAWLVATDDWRRSAWTVCRFCRHHLLPQAFEGGLHRDNTMAMSFVEAMGFRLESVRRAAGRGREDVLKYVRFGGLAL
jgi:hypothetical protein